MTEKARKLLFGRFKAENADDLDEDGSSSDGSLGADSDDSDYQAQEYTDFNNIKYHDYKYSADVTNASRPNEEEQQEMQMRKLRFLLGEVLADMGVAKKDHGIQWVGTLVFAAVMLRLTIFLHHMGQYLGLKFMDCPVETFAFGPLTSDLGYGYYYMWQ